MTALAQRVPRLLALSLRPIAIFVASRIGTLLVAGAVAYDQHTPLNRSLVFWDSSWYLRVASQGYPSAVPTGHGNGAQSTLGFFPLLPAMIRVFHDVTGVSFTRSGLLVTFGAGLVAAVLVWWLLREHFDVAGADQGTALVFFSPGAFVLSMIYSEPVMIAFAAAAMIALGRRRWLLAGVAAAFATAADPVGSAVVVLCLVAAAKAILARREWESLVAPVLAPAGIVAFFAFLWVRTGTPLAYFIAQKRGWQTTSFGDAIPNQISQVWQHGVAYPDYTIKLASLGVCLVLLVAFLWTRPPLPLTAFVLTVFVFAALSPVIGFTPRIALRAFPVLGFVGAWLRGGWFRIVFGLAVLAMAAVAILSMGSLGFTP
jgi:hypothetical protein